MSAEVSTYNDLIEDVVDLTGRGDLRNKVAGWIQLVERKIVASTYALTANTYKTTGTWLSGVDKLVLPTGCNEIESIYAASDPANVFRPVLIKELSDRKALTVSAAETDPRVYAWVSDTEIEVVPVPGADLDYELYWQGQLADVNQYAGTSRFLVEAYEALLYGAAEHAAIHNKDSESAAQWGAKAGELILIYAQHCDGAVDLIQMQPYAQHTPDHPQSTGSF